jgi:hypothetical protein
VENLLPDFDFDYTIGRRLASTGGTRSVVLMVVDSADFDGSFPRKMAKLVSATIEENHKAWKEGKPANLPRMVLVVTKIDLLPSTVEPVRLGEATSESGRGRQEHDNELPLCERCEGLGAEELGGRF